MNTADNGREARSRNLQRLRTITIGTAALGVAATGGFGWLAAVSYHGSTTGTAYATNAGSASTGSIATNGTSTGATTNLPTLTSVQGRAQVTTGGS